MDLEYMRNCSKEILFTEKYMNLRLRAEEILMKMEVKKNAGNEKEGGKTHAEGGKPGENY